MFEAKTWWITGASSGIGAALAAALAAKGDWAAFDKLTEELVGGVRK